MNVWYGLLISVIINLSMFVIAYARKTDKLTDISYALSFVLLVIYSVFVSGANSIYELLLAFMVILWAARIGTFLFIRIQKSGRDKRFDEMRSHFWKFLRFWLLQAVTVWVVMLGFLEFYLNSETPIFLFSIIGIAIWGIGLTVETIADWQKYKFNQQIENKNKWIETGLWKYSRHPNYFGEILVWFGVFVFVVSGIEGSAQYVAMISPVFITFLLLFVSGVPLLEKSADARWGSDKKYRRYKKSTSIIVPFPPKT